MYVCVCVCCIVCVCVCVLHCVCVWLGGYACGAVCVWESSVFHAKSVSARECFGVNGCARFPYEVGKKGL